MDLSAHKAATGIEDLKTGNECTLEFIRLWTENCLNALPPVIWLLIKFIKPELSSTVMIYGLIKL
jgi:hypothetical protein